MDEARNLVKTGETCPPEVLETIRKSRLRIQEADSHVHKALESRKEGNLLAAHAELERALEIYPKYYWVQTLIRNIQSSIQAELDSLRNEASYLESRGDAAGALSSIRAALELSPEDTELELEAARLEGFIGREQTEKNARDLLQRARIHLRENRFNEAQRLLTNGDSLVRLGTRGEELLFEVLERRREYISRKFDDVLEMEKKGDLQSAARQTLYIFELTVPEEQLSLQVVKFARLLGMKFYSAGELSRARELWSKALVMDPGNIKLQSYIKEVDARLENLDRIKEGDGETDGK